jgi:hypothetical protein
MIALCRQPFLQERTHRVHSPSLCSTHTQPTPDGDQTLPCPAARGMPIFLLESTWSRLSDPALCGLMATPVGATGSKVRFARHSPRTGTLEIVVPAGFAECVDDNLVVEAPPKVPDGRPTGRNSCGAMPSGEPIPQIDVARVLEDHIRFCHHWAVRCSQFDTKGSHHRSGDSE